jgi:hypothetical protein
MKANEIAKTFEDCAIDHEPEGWPAVQQKELSEAAAMLRKQDSTIKMMRAVLGVIAWSNDSKWQSDAAKEALAATEEFQK